jgi:protein-tyrosine phosphatase
LHWRIREEISNRDGPHGFHLKTILGVEPAKIICVCSLYFIGFARDNGRYHLSILVLTGCRKRKAIMFRRVDLPERVNGKLLLHSMPGRFEKIEAAWQQLKTESVSAIVCLSERYEISQKSSGYAEALENGTVPCAVLPFEIREGSVPEDRDGFWAFASDIANRLQSGEAVLIHCAGGIGRTAMLAVSVLLILGEPMNAAEAAVSRAGSIVETTPQMEMLSWCAARMSAKL